MRHAAYGEGTSKDGSLYKYSRAMARLFISDGFFSSRDDFFKEGADAAYEIFMKIAKDKIKAEQPEEDQARDAMHDA